MCLTTGHEPCTDKTARTNRLIHYHSWKLQQFSSVQSLSCVQLFATPWTAVRQVSLSITSSRSLLKLTSIESVMPSNHLILCHPLLPLPSIFPSIRVFPSESVLCIRWSRYLIKHYCGCYCKGVFGCDINMWILRLSRLSSLMWADLIHFIEGLRRMKGWALDR